MDLSVQTAKRKKPASQEYDMLQSFTLMMKKTTFARQEKNLRKLIIKIPFKKYWKVRGGGPCL